VNAATGAEGERWASRQSAVFRNALQRA
jgi:hypothetical protein